MNRQGDSRIHLARAWRFKGRPRKAVQTLAELLEAEPDHVAALAEMGNALLESGEVRRALQHYDLALERDPDLTEVRFRRGHVQMLLQPNRHSRTVSVPDAPGGRLRLNLDGGFQRGGWATAMNALRPLHNQNGILFDGFIESNFSWRHWRSGRRDDQILDRLRTLNLSELLTSEELGVVPYREPWVGILHNPPRMPDWFHAHDSPQSIMAKEIWRDSLPTCKGLFTLSRYQADWLCRRVDVPVSALVHPAEIPAQTFSFRRFRDNDRKHIVQVGWWLRKLNSIDRLPLPRGNRLGYRKMYLVPHFFPEADRYLDALRRREREELNLELEPQFSENTVTVQHLPKPEYDRLLSENIIFFELYDAGANSALVDCIARATPVLVNPLPAVIEYLGQDYPLYFSDLDEAAQKALDLSLIESCHEYLKKCTTRRRLAPEQFLESLIHSKVYRGLPPP